MCGLGEVKNPTDARKQMISVVHAATRDAETLVLAWTNNYYDHNLMRAKCKAIILSAQGVVLALADFVTDSDGSNNGLDVYTLEKLMACEKFVETSIRSFGYGEPLE